MVHSWPGYVAEPPAWDMAWRNCHRHGVHHTHQTSFPQQSTAEILPYQAHPLWGSRFSASAASLQPPAIFPPPPPLGCSWHWIKSSSSLRMLDSSAPRCPGPLLLARLWGGGGLGVWAFPPLGCTMPEVQLWPALHSAQWVGGWGLVSPYE